MRYRLPNNPMAQKSERLVRSASLIVAASQGRYGFFSTDLIGIGHSIPISLFIEKYTAALRARGIRTYRTNPLANRIEQKPDFRFDKIKRQFRAGAAFWALG